MLTLRMFVNRTWNRHSGTERVYTWMSRTFHVCLRIHFEHSDPLVLSIFATKLAVFSVEIAEHLDENNSLWCWRSSSRNPDSVYVISFEREMIGLCGCLCLCVSDLARFVCWIEIVFLQTNYSPNTQECVFSYYLVSKWYVRSSLLDLERSLKSIHMSDYDGSHKIYEWKLCVWEMFVHLSHICMFFPLTLPTMQLILIYWKKIR